MFWIVSCFMYPRVFTKDGSCGAPQNILGLGPLKALIRPWTHRGIGGFFRGAFYTLPTQVNGVPAPFVRLRLRRLSIRVELSNLAAVLVHKCIMFFVVVVANKL